MILQQNQHKKKYFKDKINYITGVKIILNQCKIQFQAIFLEEFSFQEIKLLIIVYYSHIRIQKYSTDNQHQTPMHRKIKIQTMQLQNVAQILSDYQIDLFQMAKMHKNNKLHREFNTNQSQFCERVYKKSSSKQSKKKIKQRYSLHSNGKYNEQYQRLQQNSRIIKRIINPKRDKIILKSIQIIKNQVGQSGGFPQNQIRAKSEHRNRKVGFKQYEKQRNGESQQEYLIKLQNQRMGKRIINAKSLVRNLISADTFQRKRVMCRNFKSKINKGVIAFFNNGSNKIQQSSKQNLAINQLKSYYGFGPTIICITNMKIDFNPPLKNQDLVYLQLIVKSSNKIRSADVSLDQQSLKEANQIRRLLKLYTTNIIPYSALQQKNIKFAISLKKIGEFVPLKVWRVQGNSNIQIGIVDIPFSKYLNQEDDARSTKIMMKNVTFSEQGGDHNYEQCNNINFDQKQQQNTKQLNINSKTIKNRTQIHQKISCRLRKNKVEQIQGSISFQYSIYRKKYS